MKVLFIFLSCIPLFFVYPSCSLANERHDRMRTLYAVDFVLQSEQEIKPGLSLEGELGMIVASGNTDATSINAKLRSTQETESWSNRYEAEALYTNSRQLDVDQRNRVTAQRLYFASHADYKLDDPDKRIFLFADFEDNRFNAFEYQASIATGWAQLKWHGEVSSFRYSIGPGYNFAERKNGDPDDNTGLIVRASAEYNYKWSSGARLRQYFSTAAGDTNTRSRSETSISANVFDALAMKFSFRLDHDTSPKLDDASLNTETSVALVYQFF